MPVTRIKTEQRIVPNSVNTIRELFSNNEIDLNPHEIKNSLRVIGYNVPNQLIAPTTLKSILDKNAKLLVTFNALTTYCKYRYGDYDVTISFFDDYTSIFIK